jgi:flagellin-like protein
MKGIKADTGMKGITPIIAIIILLLITVAIAGAGYSYITMYSGGLTNRQIEVTDASCRNGVAVVNVKNIGTQPFNTTSVQVINGRDGSDITPSVQWQQAQADESLVLELKLEE